MGDGAHLGITAGRAIDTILGDEAIRAYTKPTVGTGNIERSEYHIDPLLADALRAASKALAGCLLERLTETKAETT